MRKFGWRRDLPHFEDKKYFFHRELIEMEALPKQVDLRSQMSPIEDQRQLGSCVAHATCGALEFLELKELQDPKPGVEEFDSQFERISRLFVYYNARNLDGDPTVDGGTQLRSAIQVIKSQGICRETLWPYDVSKVFDMPVKSAYDEAVSHQVLQSYSINHRSLSEMQSCLAKGYPFILGISVYDSFMSQSVAESGMIPMPKSGETLQGGHALCCVGYDMDKRVFIIRNSWSESWGDKGYCYIPFEYLTHPGLAGDFWTLRKEYK